ncbi:MAG TPA: protein kinase [Gemmatimonadaceae bacterium]|nr:protein kinase [Gemmatimonadaceae bacterium]
MPRLSLTWKVFLGTALVVATVLGLTLALTSRSARRAADEAVGRGLVATREQVLTLLTAREGRLLDGARVFVQNPGFRSVVQLKGRANALDQATEAVQQTGASWVQIIDDAGVRLAKSNDPNAAADTLAGSALIGGALEGENTAGFGVEADTALLQTVAVPIQNPDPQAGGRVDGVLMAARRIDRAVVDSVKQATQSEVILYLLDRSNAPRVAVSTLPVTPALRIFLENRLAAPDSAAAESPQTGALARAEVELGGTHYVGQGAPLRSAGGSALGGFIALRSRDVELAAFNQLRNTILGAGVAGIALAFLLSFLIARQITRPVAALVAATRRAADGDYAADITVRSRDEIGTLADAFRAMLADLREKQALVELLGTAEGRGTVPLTQPATALAPAGGGGSGGSGSSGSAATLVSGGGGGGAYGDGRTGPRPGQTFAGRYDIKELLGAGGMGMVFKAVDRELDEVIAIKTLRPEFVTGDPTALERFKSEIRLARKISHRNVVRTHDLGEAAGVYFITMEFVEGKSLRGLLDTRGKLPVAISLTIGKQLCRALEVAHEQGVIHRDIKPQNVAIEPDGVLKVMDFGIARLTQQRNGRGVTRTGMVVGTPGHMPPEQLLGDELDARVDIYATGVLIYESLTGRLPHLSDSPITLIAKILEETPPAPRALDPDIPEALSALIMRTLSREREHRPRSAVELHDALAKIG